MSVSERDGHRREDEPIPRIPRGKGLALSGPVLLRIAMFAGLLVAVIALREPCANAVAGFMKNFEPDAGVEPVHEPRGTLITPDMPEDERRRLIERELDRAREGDRPAEQPVTPDAR